MKICYVDESGCTGALPSSTSNIQPILIVAGVIIDYNKLHEMTDRLLNLKQEFFPNLAPSSVKHMGWMLPEVKGAELRKDACSSVRSIRRHRIGYMAQILKICEDCDAKLIGRIWVKSIAQPVDGTAIYTYSIQSIYTIFQNYLTKTEDTGFVIVDSRLKHLNTPVSHSIFTQKFKGTGDSYDRIIELPAFSHSDNHAGIQIADTICSAIIMPIAINTYCEGYISSVHVRPKYSEIKRHFADRCRKLQHRYTEASGRDKGGFVVSDGLAKRPGGNLFKV